MKEVIMRHFGREGTAEVQTVNFLTKQARFLTYREIERMHLPENEIYGLGLELMAHVKNDWAQDWGGSGEIRWIPGGDARIRHYDRREVDFAKDITLPREEIRTILSGDIPEGREVTLLDHVDVSFAIEDGAVVFGDHSGSAEGELLPVSRSLAEQIDQAIRAMLEAIQTNESIGSQLVSGRASWNLSGNCYFNLALTKEKYDILFFTVARGADISV
ncbi:hypothetical protein Salmuc_03295 [Salipiger mucosus DSM 16094]|uniref:Uncharacterized protein n=1 Tax=Salipiger mucosus DSM 16094 TaxID=1123237 RepID=S9QEH1_9RHOB|nr:hypothetical protein Salmuc_03295 [Salipiger mucosus DSM 16094]